MNLLCFPGASLVKNTNLSHDSVFSIVHSFALYSSKFVGEFQLQLEGEQELVHFTVRTLKVGKLKKGWKVQRKFAQVRWRATSRRVTQLVYTEWGEEGPMARESFLAFLRQAELTDYDFLFFFKILKI